MDNRFWSCGILPWPALTARSCVDESFGRTVVGRRRWRSCYYAGEDVVEVVREFVAAWVDVDGWGEGLDVDGLFYTPFYPVMLGGENGDVLLPEMVVVFAGMLQHGRFVFAEIVAGSGGVLLESGCSGPLCFADISAWAGYGVVACAWYMVHVAVCFLFAQLIFGMDECFS